MSSTYAYPGVYIQELPSPVHPITGVATSVAAFVGYTATGIDNRAEMIFSFSDYQRLFGGLASNSELSYAVQQFFLNGGSQAWVVRTPGHYNSLSGHYADVAFGNLTFNALSSGAWANGELLIDIDVQGLNLSTTTSPPGDPLAFNLTVSNLATNTTEYFPALSLNGNLQNFIANVLNDPDNGSQLVNVDVTGLPTLPTLPPALTVSGVVGAALASTPVTTGGVTTNYLESVNAILGGGSTATTASADCSLILNLPSTYPPLPTIKVIGKGAPIPQSVQGLASQLQTAISSVLAVQMTGASVSCVAAPIWSGGAPPPPTGNRVNVLLPNMPDAVISFSSPPASPPVNDAATALGLTAGLVGSALTVASVQAALGGSSPPHENCTLEVNLPSVISTPVLVTVYTTTETIPSSGTPGGLAGIALDLETAINDALAAVPLPDVSVTCSVVSSGSGSGIQVNAIVPGQADAPVTFTALPTTPTNFDAATALGLVGAGSTTLAGPTTVNVAHYALGTGNAPLGEETLSTPAVPMDGLPGADELIGDPLAQSGIYALSKVAFNLLCIPDAVRASAGNPTVLDFNNTSLDPVAVYSAAIALCDQCRAMLLIDPPPNVTTVAAAVDWKSSTIGVVNANGAAFWPRLRLADPLNNSQLRTFAPSGLVAGVYANTDTTRGVWKAPAGIGAVLNGVQNMTYQMGDAENGVLNPLGLNCFRTFPVYGPVLWGARTLLGADAEASQWKYVPIRRVALFLESSLYQGTKWVVFEPNDEPLWSAIRLNIGSFMQNLFIQGYFQGQTPDQAYFVKCDSETTTQTDIDNGVVNIVVGFAPLYPAEFVVIQIQQMTGQTSS